MNVHVEPYIGQHCETTATGTLLNQIGLRLSEPMLFGLGEGLSFIYWNMKSMDFPFIGGRIKPDQLTVNIAKNLNLELVAHETSSTAKAWEGVKELLDSDRAVGLKLDCYHLEYFTQPIHFAGHYVAMVGYDEQKAYLVDTRQQGTNVTSSLKSLAKARSEKGPMSSRNLYYTIQRDGDVRLLTQAVRQAIHANTTAYLNPPIKNLTFRGIEKASIEIIKWFDRSTDIRLEFATSAMMMERAGTGGALFRNLYRDFLAEAHQLTGDANVGAAHKAFIDIAAAWSEVINLFEQVARTGERDYILKASEMMKALAYDEQCAMRLLA